MKVIRTIECPNCGKILEEIEVRRSFIRRKTWERGTMFFAVKGIYKWRVKKKCLQKD